MSLALPGDQRCGANEAGALHVQHRLAARPESSLAPCWPPLEATLAIGPRSTQDKLRVTAALETLPAFHRALSSGEPNWCAVRELTRVTSPETEQTWLSFARGKTTRQLDQSSRANIPATSPNLQQTHHARCGARARTGRAAARAGRGREQPRVCPRGGPAELRRGCRLVLRAQRHRLARAHSALPGLLPRARQRRARPVASTAASCRSEDCPLVSVLERSIRPRQAQDSRSVRCRCRERRGATAQAEIGAPAAQLDESRSSAGFPHPELVRVMERALRRTARHKARFSPLSTDGRVQTPPVGRPSSTARARARAASNGSPAAASRASGSPGARAKPACSSQKAQSAKVVPITLES
jgi:hypothetical protein